MTVNILIVADEKDIQALLEQKYRKEIKDKLVSFAFAFSGEEALAYLEKNEQEVVSGNIGSASLRRLDYTVIGDVVNTAQRL